MVLTVYYYYERLRSLYVYLLLKMTFKKLRRAEMECLVIPGY